MVLPNPPPSTGNSIDATVILAEYQVPQPFDLRTLYAIRPSIPASGTIALSNFYGVNSFSSFIAYDAAGSTNVSANFTMLQAGFTAGNTLSTSSIYVDSVANQLIKSAELRIGGQLIQTITGDFIQIEQDLSIPYENQSALNVLVGKDDTTLSTSSRTYIANLPFWFYNRPELAVPIVALERHDLEVYINFAPISSLQSSLTTIPKQYDAAILADIAYVTEPEMNFFKKNRLDYVITQLQVSTGTIPALVTDAIFQTYFVNPVYEIYVLTGNSFAFTDQLQNFQYFFNGYSKVDENRVFIKYIAPFEHHTMMPEKNICIKSFAKQPEKEPTTYVNMSRIRQQIVEVTINSSSTPTPLTIYAKNYNVLRIENGLAGLMFNSSK